MDADKVQSETMFESMMLEHQKQKEELNKKFLELERVLDAKQELEMEVEDLKGKLKAMKHLGDEDDDVVQEKIKTMNDELKSKMEEMDDMKNLDQTLVIKERQSNAELQEARKKLIKTFQDITGKTIVCHDLKTMVMMMMNGGSNAISKSRL